MKIFFWLVALLIFFFLWAKYIERHNIYFPTKEINTTPGLIGLPYEEVYFETADHKRLHGWFIPSNEAGFTFLFCHGNGGNISHRLEKIALFYDMGFSTFIFDYRGYGISEGIASEQGLYKDVDAAYEYLVKKRNISEHDIILYGESLGAAVAIELAGGEDVGALITEDAFTSLKDMAKIVYPFLPSFIIANKFDSISKIKDVTCPKLLIHSIDDEIVPFYLGERLFNAARSPKKQLKTRGAHNTAFSDSEKEVKDAIKSFLEGLSSDYDNLSG